MTLVDASETMEEAVEERAVVPSTHGNKEAAYRPCPARPRIFSKHIENASWRCLLNAGFPEADRVCGERMNHDRGDSTITHTCAHTCTHMHTRTQTHTLKKILYNPMVK